jgi:hypothetical protein
MATKRKDLKADQVTETVDDFTLKAYHKPAYALVSISKREQVLLNRWNEEINHPFEKGKKLPVADQATLKKVYDAGAEFQDWITPPDGYEANWAKK